MMDQMISQPQDLERVLFPHQLSAVSNLEHREVYQDIISNRNSTIHSNVGIYSDITGYGKTLTMVTLILRDSRKFDSPEPFVFETVSQIYGNGKIIKTQKSYYQRLNTTLILANPSIIKQWNEEFTFAPSIQVATITNKKKCEQLDPQLFHVILCSPTMFNHFVSRFPNYAWKRFIFDEPSFTKVPSMRNIVAGYHWLITATPDVLLYNNNTKSPYTYLGSLFSGYVEYNVFKQLIFKNDDAFVKQSVQLPVIEHKHYQCPETITQLLKDVISAEIVQMISAGNIEGVIKILGGTSSTRHDHNLFDLIRKEKEELIKECEIKIKRYTRTNDSEKIQKWTERKVNLQNQISQLETRLLNLPHNEVCRICLETVSKPVMQKCCYNIFCGSCLLHWHKHQTQCPLCRNITPPNGLIYLKDNKVKDEKETPHISITPTKMETILKIYKERKTTGAKFIIFSSFDETFELFKDIFDDECIYLLKGKKFETKHKILDEFKNTTAKGAILFLNSIEHGAGLNLQEATDVILYHEMPEYLESQVIGRCYRMGRNLPLTIHHLHT